MSDLSYRKAKKRLGWNINRAHAALHNRDEGRSRKFGKAAAHWGKIMLDMHENK